jgi:hypothetical protein
MIEVPPCMHMEKTVIHLGQIGHYYYRGIGKPTEKEFKQKNGYFLY